MSHFKYFSYPAFGEQTQKEAGYSQAVRVGDRIEVAGQGGWDRQTLEIPKDITKEIEQAFGNVEVTLKDAGASGWKSVFFVRAYCAPLDEESMGIFSSVLKQYCPDHQPVVTGVGVANLAFEGMRVEIEVSAHVPAER